MESQADTILAIMAAMASLAHAAGTNDAAVISGTSTGAVLEAGGTTNGTVGTPTATGTLTDTDVDNTEIGRASCRERV